MRAFQSGGDGGFNRSYLFLLVGVMLFIGFASQSRLPIAHAQAAPASSAPMVSTKQIALRVLSPRGEAIHLDDISGISIIQEDGVPWEMGPKPKILRRYPDEWVAVDATMFSLHRPGLTANMHFQTGGAMMIVAAKLPESGWRSLEFTSAATPNEIGADLSAGPANVAAGEIAGVVVDPQGNPVAGAVASFPRPVQFTRLPSTRPVTTGADGIFHFGRTDDLGGLYLQVEKPGFAPRWITDVPDGKGFAVHLDDKTRLAGRLTLPDGSPAANAKIEVDVAKASLRYGDSTFAESIPYSAQADAQGAYDLPLEPGEYDVKIISGAFVARYQHFQLTSGKTSALPPELASGAKLSIIAISTVTAKPVPGVRFTQVAQTPGYQYYVDGGERITDEKGAASWDGMLPGPTQFNVRADGYTRWWVADGDANPKPGERGIDTIRLDLSVGMPLVMVAMEPGVHVTGQVLSPTGEPVSGAAMDIGHLRTGDTRYAKRSDAKGNYSLTFGKLPATFGGPPPGTKGSGYFVVAYDPKQRWANGISEEFDGAPGDEKSFVLHMTAGGHMRGKVVYGSGEPVAKIEVIAVATDLIDLSYYSPRTITDDQGRFDLGPMRAAEYELHPSIRFGQGIPTQTRDGKTTIALNDHAPVVTIKDGDSLDIPPIVYDGPPPGPIPAHYDREYPWGLK